MSDTEGVEAPLTVGIVAYNSLPLLETTVRSVLALLPAEPQARVLLLDNCSSDGSGAVIRRLTAADPRVTPLFNDRNVGFGGGHNRILAHVDSTYHIICNPDIELTPGAVETLLDFLREHPSAGLVCPKVLYRDGRLQPLNRLRPNVLDLLLRRFLPRRLRPLFRLRMERYEMLDRGYEQSYPVPFVSGAFMVCRTEALRQADGFDRRYFLYFEDADLSRKLQAAGWETLYCPDAAVIHDWQRDAHKSLRGMLQFMQSGWRYFRKWGWQWV